MSNAIVSSSNINSRGVAWYHTCCFSSSCIFVVSFLTAAVFPSKGTVPIQEAEAVGGCVCVCEWREERQGWWYMGRMRWCIALAEAISVKLTSKLMAAAKHYRSGKEETHSRPKPHGHYRPQLHSAASWWRSFHSSVGHVHVLLTTFLLCLPLTSENNRYSSILSPWFTVMKMSTSY